MKNLRHAPPIFNRLHLLVICAVALLSLGRAQAQYVSTSISNGLSQPYGVTTDPNNNVYVTDTLNNRVVVYASGFLGFTNLAGNSAAGTNNGAGTSASFNQPEGIVYARGGLVVVDQYNQQLRFITLGGVVSNLAGTTGNYGYTDGAALGGAQFSYPTGVAVANDGVTLYIADQGNNAIRVLSSNNVVSTLALGTNYLFHSPSAVAVDAQSNLWIADSLNQVICLVSNGLLHVVAGTYRTVGTNDSTSGITARFNLPSGLFWDQVLNMLVVSDTRNNTIRGITITNAQNQPTYPVKTLAGLPGTAGFIDGNLSVAEFFHPYGIAQDVVDSGYYIVDSGNNALRVLQPTQPPPPPTPIAAPAIGYVTFPVVNGTPQAQFNPITATISVFNNPPILAVEQLDSTVSTYVSDGATGTAIPLPGTNSSSIIAFTSVDIGVAPGNVPLLNIQLLPALTLEAVSAAPGRSNSPVASARFQFITGAPSIVGDDAADLFLSSITTNAQIYYTLNGTTPTNDGSDGVGPITNGQVLSLNITNDELLTARAFAPNFAPSGVVSEMLYYSNFIGNQLTFGFPTGNSSSKFMTAAGRYFYAPVTLTLLPGATMYSLQFNLNETNILGTNPAPQVNSSGWGFQPYLLYPGMSNGIPVLSPIIPNGLPYTNTILDKDSNLAEIGWLETYPFTNIYPSTSQDLISFSAAHEEEFLEADGRVVVGAFSFPVPANAPFNSQYSIQAALPSATTFFPPSTLIDNVPIQAPTNGSTGAGTINAYKLVTVGTASYLVGDANPFSWFNAGDFGDTNLLNDDVLEVFQIAVEGVNQVPQNSDYYDAMDSSDGSSNGLYDSSDSSINSIMTGDGQLQVDDVYVTFRRSLDTNLNRYVRNWSNGVLTVTTLSNYSMPNLRQKSAVAQTQASPRSISVASDQVQTAGALTAQVPIRITAADPLYALRVFLLNVEIDPLDGSPLITNQITFSPSTNLGSPTFYSSQGSNNVAGAWLSSTVAGINGTNIIGTLLVTLPSTVNSNSAYRVHFNKFSGSPNGLALFNSSLQDGLITLCNRTNSSWNDNIPDSWRLLWFGTVSNAMSAAALDADGDGASNWQEYIAGTNPTDATSVFRVISGTNTSQFNFGLQWPSVVNKTYSVQTCSGLSSTWTTIGSNIAGNGQVLQWTDTNANGKGAQFYRAQVQ